MGRHPDSIDPRPRGMAIRGPQKPPEKTELEQIREKLKEHESVLKEIGDAAEQDLREHGGSSS